MCSICQDPLEVSTFLTLIFPARLKWLSATIIIAMFNTVLSKLEMNDGEKSEEVVGVRKIRECLPKGGGTPFSLRLEQDVDGFRYR